MVFAIDTTSSAPLGKLEAEEITKAIQGNFDSLGTMLEVARNRKAWKALGYKDFEAYCNNEFGKSQRRAYELIAEAAIAQSLKKAEPSLRLPAQSNLRLLKELPMDQQLEAVKRSERLATESNKTRPDRSDLLIAINEISGARSGDMRASLEARGFKKGVEVATTRGVNIGSRGIITTVNKAGEIYVELHAGGKIPLDAASCRILSANEKPEKRAWYGTTDIGDKVLIFSKGLENTLGTIKTRLTSEKMVGVEVNGQVLKLPYAELEVVKIKIDEPEQDSWLQNFIWNDFGSQWCYDSESEAITTVYPDLKLHPTEKGKGSPADWVRNWAKKNIPNLAFDLLDEEQLATLIKSKLIICGGEEEKGNLAESLIAEIWKMALPSECRKKVKALISGADKARGISFALTLSELSSGKKTQTRRAWQDDYAKSFVRYFEDGIEIPALDKGQHRGGKEIGKIRLTEKPYQQLLSEMPITDLEKEGGMCANVQEFIDRFFDGQDKLVWVLDFEFLPSPSDTEVLLQENQRLREQLQEAEVAIQEIVNTASATPPLASPEISEFLLENNSETSSPGDTAAHTDFLVENNTPTASDSDAPKTSEFLLENDPETSSPGDTAAHTDFLVENDSETSSPGDTAAHTDSLVENNTPTASDADAPKTSEFLLENNTPTVSDADASENSENSALKIAVSQHRKKVKEDIARIDKELLCAKKADSVKLQKTLDELYSRLLELDLFEGTRIGQVVEKKIAQGNHGLVTKLDFSPGGLPQIWIDWGKKFPECSTVASLNFSPAIVAPTTDLDVAIQEAISQSRINLLAWRDHAVRELAEAEEHNQSIFLRKIEGRNRLLCELEAFEKLRIGQFASHRLSLRRGEILSMRIEGERLEVEMQWEVGQKEILLFSDIVPEQIK